MPRFLLPLGATLLAFLAALPSAATAAVAATPFEHQSSDLKPDPAARFGALPNGLRYVIRANAEPKNRASLRLVVETGSLFETEDQRGLAHFLEHMAFNGSTHYAPDTLVEVFQRLGMNFGGDSNASTSFDRTLYMFELPDTKEATFAEAFQVFNDYAGGLLLQDKEIDKERGVILSEMRARDSVSYRTTVAGMEFELAGTLFPKRLAIGVKEVLEKANRVPFVDFYNTWYRPERMSVVIVGDIDAAAVEKQLVAAFSGLAARAPARPLPSYGKLSDATGVKTAYHYESEAPATAVGITTITPYAYEPDTAANRLKYLPRTLAIAMLNRRLEILAKKENSTFTTGSAYAAEAFDFLRSMGIEVTCKPEQWRDALSTAEQELRRALDFGFQASELREAIANMSNGLEEAVKTDSTRRSNGIANEIAGTLVDKDVFTTPAADLALYGPALTRVTVEQCAAAFREAWNVPHRYIMVSGNAVIAAAAPTAATASAEQAIAGAYNTSRAVAVTAPEATKDIAWGYTDFGPAGRVTERREVADIGATLITFSNGVRLNLKKTDFEANRIRLGLRVGTGMLTEPKDKPGLTFLIDGIFASGGLGKHSVDDLDRILAGKTVGFGFNVGGDALSVGGVTNRNDLLLQLQYITAYLTDPGYRPEALRQALKELDEEYTGLEHELSGPLQLEVQRLLAGGDARFGTPAKDIVLKRTVDEAKAWLTPQLASGPIEITVIGDLDVTATIDAVAKTVGALPTRAPRPDVAALRQVRVPAPFTKDFTVDTEIPKGVVVFYWPTLDEDSIRENRRLSVLGSVFDDRLRVKVREELGGAYSPAAGNAPSIAFKGFGFMQANVIVDPAEAKKIGDAVLAIASDLSRDGITADELARAKQPILTGLREDVRTNTYWGRVLSRAQEKPEVMDWSRTRTADFESITKADVDTLARTYLAPGRAFRVTVLPRAGMPIPAKK